MNQKNKILEHLVKFGNISTWQAIQDYHITRLSAHILALKSEGHPITPVWETDGEKRWVRYYYDKKF